MLPVYGTACAKAWKGPQEKAALRLLWAGAGVGGVGRQTSVRHLIGLTSFAQAFILRKASGRALSILPSIASPAPGFPTPGQQMLMRRGPPPCQGHSGHDHSDPVKPRVLLRPAISGLPGLTAPIPAPYSLQLPTPPHPTPTPCSRREPVNT